MQVTASMEALTKQKFARVEKRLKYAPQDLVEIRVVINTAPLEKFYVKADVLGGRKDYFSDHEDYTVESALINTVEEILRMMEKDKDGDWDKARDAKEALAEELVKEE